MSIPLVDRAEYVVSSLGSETFPQNVIAKSSLWTLQLSFGRFILKEYNGYFTILSSPIAKKYLLTPALKSDKTINTNRFWVWIIDYSDALTLYEIEPFTTASPSITYTKSITTNVDNVSCFIKENDSVRVLVLSNGPSATFNALTYGNIFTDSPTITSLTWGATRTDNFSDFVGGSANTLDIAYLRTSSPPNVFTDSYTVPVPTGLTGYQIVGTLSVQMSWNTSAGSDNYVLQRANDSGFTTNLTTVYDGPLLTFLDTTTTEDHYYYRVLAQVTSLALNSYWSSTFDIIVIFTSIDFSGVPTSGYIPFDVQFVCSVLGMTYDWDFGDGSSHDHTYNPLHTYNPITARTFTVTLIVTTPGGPKTVTKPDYITAIAPPPTADFSGTPVDDEYPLVVQFTDTSSAPSPATIVSWYWDFGDGYTSTEQNPQHIYNVPGLYNVSLTVTNSYSLSDTETKIDYIRARGINLIVDFIGVPRDGESPLVVDFTNLTQIPAGHALMGWLWDFGDGSTSTEENPTHTYLPAGYFTVSLTAYVAL